MRVCLLNDSFPPQIDGVANVVLNYAEYLQKNHGSSLVLVPSYPRAQDAYDFDVIRYPSLPLEKIIGYRAGLAMDARTHYRVACNPPDLIHSHCPFVSSILARGLKEETHAPLVFTYHTKFDQDLKRILHNPPLESLMTKMVVDNISASDEVWAVSYGAGENLKSLGYQGDVRVMPNGVDFPLGNTRGIRTQELMKRHRIPADVPVFLFVGRMLWYKGQRLILDSLAVLRREGFDFRMIFVGDGNDRREMEKYARELGLEDRCLFVGAVYDRELLRDYFSLCSLMLFPSLYDTNGIVVREAAACALGSLLIEGSCAAEGILDGQEGWLCRNTVEDMSAKLRSLLQNESAIRCVGEQAQKSLYLSWEDAVALAHERYEVILDEYHSGRLRSRRQFSDNVFMISAEMQNSFNRVMSAEDRAQRKLYAMRRRAAWDMMRSRKRATFHARRLRGHVEEANQRIRTTAHRISAAPKKIWEDIERYL